MRRVNKTDKTDKTDKPYQPSLFIGDQAVETYYCRRDCVAYLFIHHHNDRWPEGGWSHTPSCPVYRLGLCYRHED